MSEGNLNDLSTGLKAIDLVPETAAVGSEIMIEPNVIKNVPINRDYLFITNQIKQFMPTGWEVTVDLPFVPNGRDSLFLIRATPFMLPIVTTSGSWWVYHKNSYQWVIHDVTASADSVNPAVALIPPGVTITQVHDPPPLCVMTANHRIWKGSFNFHIRVIGNFIQSGYIRTQKLRRVVVPYGFYDRYKYTPVPQKDGCFLQSGQFNSYMRSDVTMFRHQEITIPFEKQTPVDLLNKHQATYDALAIIDNAWDDEAQKWLSTDENTTAVIDSYEDFIAVEAVGALASGSAAGQIRFVIEIAANDDFELFAPLPANNRVFAPQSRYFNQDGSINKPEVHNSDITIPDFIPNSNLTSDGQNTITTV